MIPIGRLKGVGTLIAGESKRTGVKYEIEIWQGHTGLKSTRGTLSATVEAGPWKLILEDGRNIDVFVTTAGTHGADFLVKGSVPEFEP
jgi:hypothetical protein